MKAGNWIPLDKRLVYFLPKDRPFTTLEALFSLTFNRDSKRPESISGYAARWKWDRKKVRRFLDGLDAGGDISAKDKGHPKGHPIRLVSNSLQEKKDMKADTISYPQSNEPIKENDKGIALKKARTIPVSLSSFLNRHAHLYDKEAIQAIQYFLLAYRKRKGRLHPPMNPNVWTYALSSVFKVFDDYHEDELELPGMKAMIDQYFKTDFGPDCDYHLPHFLDPSIKVNRYYEAVY